MNVRPRFATTVARQGLNAATGQFPSGFRRLAKTGNSREARRVSVLDDTATYRTSASGQRAGASFRAIHEVI